MASGAASMGLLVHEMARDGIRPDRAVDALHLGAYLFLEVVQRLDGGEMP